MTNGVNAGSYGPAMLDLEMRRDVAIPVMFFRRWLANPLQMGSINPSSAALCRRMVRHARQAAIDAVAPGRGFLHYSYCFTSPLPWRRHALAARREAWTPLNFPPVSAWRYVPAM